MIKVSIVDRIPHTRLNGVARYMLGITGLENPCDWNIDLRVRIFKLNTITPN